MDTRTSYIPAESKLSRGQAGDPFAHFPGVLDGAISICRPLTDFPLTVVKIPYLQQMPLHRSGDSRQQYEHPTPTSNNPSSTPETEADAMSGAKCFREQTSIPDCHQAGKPLSKPAEDWDRLPRC
jgi:hypothetical protein